MEKLPSSLFFEVEVRLSRVIWEDGSVSHVGPKSAALPQVRDLDGQIGVLKLYTVNKLTPPPRTGSINWEVWDRAAQLPQPFTRSQFESVVGPAMRYDAVTEKFGIPTNFPTLRRARQQYFSEFRKRQWIVEVKSSQALVETNENALA